MRVLVVDDDVKVQAMLQRGLELEGYDVAVAKNAEEAFRFASQQTYDVHLIDVMLPGESGVSLCRRLRQRGNQGLILVTARGETIDRVIGLDSGADDYITKPFAFEELLARIRAVVRRYAPHESSQLVFEDLELDLREMVARRAGKRIELSPTELKLLRLFLEHPGQVLSKDQILQRVWGYDFGGDDNVVEVYVGYLRRKLEDGERSRLIHTQRGFGYVMRS